MKKKLMLILGLMAASQGFAATVRIENKSKHSIWARINDATRPFETEKLMNTLYALHALPVGGSLVVGAVSLVEGGNVANFKKIEPKKSTFFNSELTPIKKITFLRVAKTKHVEKPAKEILQDLARITLKYGNIRILHTLKHGKNEITIQNDFDGTHYKYTFKSLEEKMNYKMPVFEQFVVHPDIDTLTTEARVHYNGWKNVVRLKSRLFASPEVKVLPVEKK